MYASEGDAITCYIMQASGRMNTYDHRTLKTRLPVRSALFKQRTGGLVVRWVTTSEYPLLYVFCLCFARLVSCVDMVVNKLVGTDFFFFQKGCDAARAA